MMCSPWVVVYCPEERLWTVGFYDPAGMWHGVEDHDSFDLAALRIHFLNGGRFECGAMTK